MYEDEDYVEEEEEQQQEIGPVSKKKKKTTTAVAPTDSDAVGESSFECELRWMQKNNEIVRWLVQAPRNHKPAPFKAPQFLFTPSSFMEVQSPFVIVRVLVVTTSQTYGELLSYQSNYEENKPDRFVPPRILKAGNYYAKGSKPATGMVDGPTMALTAIRRYRKKQADSGQKKKNKNSKSGSYGRVFDQPCIEYYRSCGLAGTVKTVGIRSAPTHLAPRWWVKRVDATFLRPSSIKVSSLIQYYRQWQPDVYKPSVAIITQLNLDKDDVFPPDIFAKTDAFRTSTVDKTRGKLLPILRVIENSMCYPFKGASFIELCHFYPVRALYALSDKKINALLNALNVSAERVLFGRPVYFDLPSEVYFRDFEKQALGMVPLHSMVGPTSITQDQLKLYRRFWSSAWYRGDVYAKLPETLETDEERETRRAKEEKKREDARKRKAKQRRREEGIDSDDEDFNIILDDTDDEEEEEEGPKKRKRKDKFVVALEVARDSLLESNRLVTISKEEPDRLGIVEVLAEENLLAAYLKVMPAIIRVVETRRISSGYERLMAHSEDREALMDGTSIAFAPTEADANRFSAMTQITARCHVLISQGADADNGSYEVDTLIIVRAEQFGTDHLFRILRHFTIKKRLILIGNPHAWRDPRYLGHGAPFLTLFDAEYNEHLDDRLTIDVISDNELGEDEVPDADKALGSPALLSHACMRREWNSDTEGKMLYITSKKASKALQILSGDSDMWVGTQVFYCGTVSQQARRSICPSSCNPYDAGSGMIKNGQRLYLRDTGERVTVAACGIGAYAKSMSRWSTNHTRFLDTVSARKVSAVVQTVLPLAKEHKKQEYCGCKHSYRFFPSRHSIVDGSCINIRQYSGPEVETAFLLAGRGTCRKDLITLASLTTKQCFIVTVDDTSSIDMAVMSPGPGGWGPKTELGTFLAGEKKEEEAAGEEIEEEE